MRARYCVPLRWYGDLLGGPARVPGRGGELALPVPGEPGGVQRGGRDGPPTEAGDHRVPADPLPPVGQCFGEGVLHAHGVGELLPMSARSRLPRLR